MDVTGLATVRVYRRLDGHARAKRCGALQMLIACAALTALPALVSTAAQAAEARPAQAEAAIPTKGRASKAGARSTSRQAQQARGRAANGASKSGQVPLRDGVDAEAMAEASAPDQHPRRVASNHAYVAYLMALRARDAGDLGAARHWLRQVLAFDAEADQARHLLRALEAEAGRGKAK